MNSHLGVAKYYPLGNLEAVAHKKGYSSENINKQYIYTKITKYEYSIS